MKKIVGLFVVLSVSLMSYASGGTPEKEAKTFTEVTASLEKTHVNEGQFPDMSSVGLLLEMEGIVATVKEATVFTNSEEALLVVLTESGDVHVLKSSMEESAQPPQPPCGCLLNGIKSVDFNGDGDFNDPFEYCRTLCERLGGR